MSEQFIQSDSPAFHNERGNALRTAGDFVGAALAFRRAIELDPTYTGAFNNLGLALSEQGKLLEALSAYEKSTELHPELLHGWVNLSDLLMDLNRPADALAAAKKAVAINGHSPAALSVLGLSLCRCGQSIDAIAALRQAVELDPQSASAHCNLGLALREDAQVDAAVAEYALAIQLQPDHPVAYNNLSNALHDLERYEQALWAVDKAIALKPDYAEAHNNRATILKQAGSLEDAIAATDRAIALRSDFAAAYSNRATLLALCGRMTDARVDAERAVQLSPDDVEAWSNLAVILCDAGRRDEAIAAGERAVKLAPTFAVGQTNLAMIRLTIGDYARGWIGHEYRFNCNPHFRLRPFAQPQWKGEPLNRRTILLHAEQGFGDTIQFARFVPQVTGLGGKVILEVQPELVLLLTRLEGVEQILPYGSPLPEFDLHCPLMSLPLALNVVLEDLPGPMPYLDIQPNTHAKYSGYGSDVPDQRDLQVGLVWAGRKMHSNDHNRSMSLHDLWPLARVASVTFHSLQKAPAAQQPPGELRLIDHGADMDDFLDTARLIASLDLVIAVDTAVAHLAGAMGKPTWLLLPKVADWRWMQDRDDSPWYPSMRLFRQETWGDWRDVVDRVAEALSEHSLRRSNT